MRSAVLATLAALLAGCFEAPGEGPQPPEGSVDLARASFSLERIAMGLDQPLYVTHAGDGSGRLFIVEQGGRVLVWDDGRVKGTPFLDLSGAVTTGFEQGLLSIAFPPDHEDSGLAFVDYTDRRGDTVLARYRLAAGDPDRLDEGSAQVVLLVEQPFANHNGGLALFGPDGMLYVGLGDGGSAGDPFGNGQNTDTLLGSILRLDVSRFPYTAPDDNPFVGRAGRDEIWAYGLRNPWRFSFDRANGDLYIGDVGQDHVEEVDYEPRGEGGRNHGWGVWEGSRRFSSGETRGEAVFPVAEYPLTGDRCAVTGGYAYRGEDVPALRGVYLYADYCSGEIWGLAPHGGRWEARLLMDSEMRVSSFGEDEEGELYVVDHNGAVHRVVA